jgi:hypothetical protein
MLRRHEWLFVGLSWLLLYGLGWQHGVDWTLDRPAQEACARQALPGVEGVGPVEAELGEPSAAEAP